MFKIRLVWRINKFKVFYFEIFIKYLWKYLRKLRRCFTEKAPWTICRGVVMQLLIALSPVIEYLYHNCVLVKGHEQKCNLSRNNSAFITRVALLLGDFLVFILFSFYHFLKKVQAHLATFYIFLIFKGHCIYIQKGRHKFYIHYFSLAKGVNVCMYI